MDYITATFLLEKISNTTKILNDPVAVRNMPEKLSSIYFTKLMPPSIFTKNIDEIVKFKINLVGLKSADALLYPSQISGGMKKKAGLARALAMDPKLLFLDEPTSGLDPISARESDELILKLRSLLGLSIVMVSHDLESIYSTLDRVAIIDDKKIAYEGSIADVKDSESTFIQTFFK